MTCSQYGRESSIVDEPYDQANRTVVAPSHTPAKEVDWNVFHISVGHISNELLTVSAKSMGMIFTRHLQPNEGCLGAKGTENQSPRQLNLVLIKR